MNATATPPLIERIGIVGRVAPAAAAATPDITAPGEPVSKPSVFTEVKASPLAQAIENVESRAIANEEIIKALFVKLAPIMTIRKDWQPFDEVEKTSTTLESLELLYQYLGHQGRVLAHLLENSDRL